jgi:hypothetical protein
MSESELTVNQETHGSGRFLIKRRAFSRSIVLILIWMLARLSLYYAMQKGTEGFRIMLLISPLNYEERTSWDQPTPRLLDQIPSSWLASLTAIGNEADVIRRRQDRPLRPTKRLPPTVLELPVFAGQRQ